MSWMRGWSLITASLWFLNGSCRKRTDMMFLFDYIPFETKRLIIFKLCNRLSFCVEISASQLNYSRPRRPSTLYRRRFDGIWMFVYVGVFDSGCFSKAKFVMWRNVPSLTVNGARHRNENGIDAGSLRVVKTEENVLEFLFEIKVQQIWNLTSRIQSQMMPRCLTFCGHEKVRIVLVQSSQKSGNVEITKVTLAGLVLTPVLRRNQILQWSEDILSLLSDVNEDRIYLARDRQIFRCSI